MAEMKPHNVSEQLSVCTFNCRSVKSSLTELWQLCESYDIICLQEHWLLPVELNVLSQFRSDFLSTATSAVNIDYDVLVGRPYGGTAILYKQSLSNDISIVDTNESRMTALVLQTSLSPVLLVNVYMPTNYGTSECVEEYLDICAEINVLFNECDATHHLVLGDFNCEYNTPSRFYDILMQLITDNDLVCSDALRLVNALTYCRDDGIHMSWIDHVLCSKALDDRVETVGVLHEFQSSDHKPLVVKFHNLGVATCLSAPATGSQYINVKYNWNSADIALYKYTVRNSLNKLVIP